MPTSRGATFANNTNLANAIFCNTTMPDGSPNNSGCGSGTTCCPQSCESDGDCPACQTCSAGACVAVTDGTACNAGDLCTINDSCQAGVCVAGPRRVCPINPNQCKQNVCNAQTGNCEAKNKDPFTPCNDGNPCTTQDACNFEGECVGFPVTCFGGRICCPSGPYTGTCRGGDAANCSSNIGCCSDNCVFGQFCSF